jgi:D-glycero-D-manno-heptose 1,7-bisphosphate phosphatase
MSRELSPAVFFDKDGTLIENVPYNVDCAKIRLAPGALEAAERLHHAGYQIVVITNQSGVAMNYFPLSAINGVEQRLRELLAEVNVPIAGFYFCPHHPRGVVPAFTAACECRKPQPGMIRQAARELNLDLARSWLIGDILDDVEAAHRAGCRAILLDSGGETLWQPGEFREPDLIAADLIAAAEAILCSDQDINERTWSVTYV